MAILLNLVKSINTRKSPIYQRYVTTDLSVRTSRRRFFHETGGEVSILFVIIFILLHLCKQRIIASLNVGLRRVESVINNQKKKKKKKKNVYYGK